MKKAIFILVNPVRISFTFLITILLYVFLTEECAAMENEIDIVVIQSRSLKPYQFVMDKTLKLLKEKGIRCKGRVFFLDDARTSPQMILEDIEKKKPDVILAIGSEATLFCSGNILDIPMLFSMVYRVDSIEKSIDVNSSIKGVYLNIPIEKTFKVVKSLKHGMEKVGIIYTPSLFKEQVNKIEKEASLLGISIIRSEIQTELDIPMAIKDITDNSDAVYLLPDPKTMTPDFIKKIMLATYRKKIFVFGESYEWVKKGALIGFAFDIKEVVEKTMQQLLSVVEGKPVTELKNLTCENFRLFFNARVADALGISPDKHIIAIADKTGKVIR